MLDSGLATHRPPSNQALVARSQQQRDGHAIRRLNRSSCGDGATVNEIPMGCQKQPMCSCSIVPCIASSCAARADAARNDCFHFLWGTLAAIQGGRVVASATIGSLCHSQLAPIQSTPVLQCSGGSHTGGLVEHRDKVHSQHRLLQGAPHPRFPQFLSRQVGQISMQKKRSKPARDGRR